MSTLIRLQICPDVREPRDSRDGQWHTGWRKEGALRTAFYYRRQWWACPERGDVEGPYASKEEALK